MIRDVLAYIAYEWRFGSKLYSAAVAFCLIALPVGLIPWAAFWLWFYFGR